MDNVKLLTKEYLDIKKEIYSSCLKKCLNLENEEINKQEKECLINCLKEINDLLIN